MEIPARVTMRTNVLLICLLLTLPMLAGCTGNANGDGDADPTSDASTVIINNYYNNTSYTNSGNQIWYVHGTTIHVCSNSPVDNNTDDNETDDNITLKQGSPTIPDGYCIDDSTLQGIFNSIQNYTIIHQAVDTGIILHSYSAGRTTFGHRVGTVCSNGIITGWNLNADNGESYDNVASASPDFVLPMQGLECDHYLFGMEIYEGNYTVNWHVAYEVVSVTQGPH